MNLTALGDKNEELILKDFDKIIKKWSKKLRKDDNDIKRSVSFLWEHIENEAEEGWQDYLSRNEIGPYSGR